jgi:hypothetical protein
MCKTKMKMNIYYTNVCKHEHAKNMTRLSCKIVLKMLNRPKEMMGPNFIYTPLGTYLKEASRRILCVH